MVVAIILVGRGAARLRDDGQAAVDVGAEVGGLEAHVDHRLGNGTNMASGMWRMPRLLSAVCRILAAVGSGFSQRAGARLVATGKRRETRRKTGINRGINKPKLNLSPCN